MWLKFDIYKLIFFMFWDKIEDIFEFGYLCIFVGWY